MLMLKCVQLFEELHQLRGLAADPTEAVASAVVEASFMCNAGKYHLCFWVILVFEGLSDLKPLIKF